MEPICRLTRSRGASVWRHLIAIERVTNADPALGPILQMHGTSQPPFRKNANFLNTFAYYGDWLSRMSNMFVL